MLRFNILNYVFWLNIYMYIEYYILTNPLDSQKN